MSISCIRRISLRSMCRRRRISVLRLCIIWCRRVVIIWLCFRGRRSRVIRRLISISMCVIRVIMRRMCSLLILSRMMIMINVIIIMRVLRRRVRRLMCMICLLVRSSRVVRLRAIRIIVRVIRIFRRIVIVNISRACYVYAPSSYCVSYYDYSYV